MLSALALGVFLMLRATPSPAPADEAAIREARFQQLRKCADDSPAAAVEYAEACEVRGDFSSASAYYLKAIRLDPGNQKAVDRVRFYLSELWIREAGDDPRRMDEIVERLEVAGLIEEARTLARRVILRDPAAVNSRRVLREALPDDGLADAEFEEYLRTKGIRIDSLESRERAVLRQTWQACRDFGVSESALCVVDTAPQAPFLLMLERSTFYNAELVLGALNEASVAFFRAFTAEFGKLFDGAALARTQVCPVYVFESRQRYERVRRVPEYYGGDFSPRTKRVSFYKDTNVLFETLFRLLTHAMLHQLWLTNGNELVDPKDTGMAWFSEGLSSYMEKFKRDATGGFVLGERAPDHLPYVRKLLASGKGMPLPELMAMTCRAYAGGTAKGQAWRNQVTAQSWALVYFLNKSADGKYREKLREYFATEIQGKGGAEAASRCFGDLEALDREYVEFYKSLK